MGEQDLIVADDRIVVRENPQEERVAALAAPILEEIGFRLVRVRISGREGCTVQIMAERPDGSMSIEDCTEVSRMLSPVFDVEDPLPGGYNLEISSPGIDRPLVRQDDFQRALGHEVKIKLKADADGRRRYQGLIEAVEPGAVRLRVVREDGGSETQTFALDTLYEAKLVMTERLIEEALRASKRERGTAN